VFDPFAGSGTTPSVAHKMGKKYIAVEQSSYFDSKVLVRMKYTLNGTSGGIESKSPDSGMFKYIRLESYEDSLNNLKLNRSDDQGTLLQQDVAMREQYLLSYMLDVETRGSQSLLSLEAFGNPDEYKLAVDRDGEIRLVNIDLAETFNWLIGLKVKTVDVIKGVRVVTGTSPQGEKVLILWRNVKEMTSPKLDEFFQKQGYNTKDMEFDVIYVNGDNNLENLKKDEDTWKVRLIEEDFKRLMFDVQDV
jgi:adenine-specific DNA-methyltransferase